MSNENINHNFIEDPDVKAIIERLGDEIPPKAVPLIQNAIAKIESNVSIEDALGLTPEIIEVIYKHGYHLYQSGKFREALNVFNLLHFFNPTENRYIFSIAACHHQSKNYLEAAAYYMIYEINDQKNPLPFFHLYDCFIHADHPSLARNALDEALRLAKLDPKHHELKGRIEMELKRFETMEGIVA